MLKNIHIHIGMSKTGTSRIQKFLYENNDFLQKNNFYYPKSGISPDKSHNELSFALKSSPIKSYSTPEKEKLIDLLYNEIAEVQEDNIILSSDRFSCVLDDAYFKNKFKSCNFSIIAYIRKPSTYIESWYKQWLKVSVMNLSLTFDEFFDKYYKSFSMKKRLEPWGKYISENRITISSFEDAIDEHGILIDFVLKLGIEKQCITEDLYCNQERVNVALGYMASKIMRQVNEFGDFPERQRLFNVIKQLPDSGRFKNKKFINNEQEELINKYYQSENQYLLSKYKKIV